MYKRSNPFVFDLDYFYSRMFNKAQIKGFVFQVLRVTMEFASSFYYTIDAPVHASFVCVPFKIMKTCDVQFF